MCSLRDVMTSLAPFVWLGVRLAQMVDVAILDEHFPPRGPCLLCGHPDARHRLWDALLGRHDAGDSAEELARDYGVAVEAVEAVLRVRPYEGVE